MKILLLLFISVGLGVLLRKIRQLHWLGHTSTWTVWALLLVFGFTLGCNEAIVRDFLHFGFTAFALAFAGVAGSVLFAWLVKMAIDKR